MTHDIYFVKTWTNKPKQTDVLLYVNDGCGLNNCYSIKCNKQQEKLTLSDKSDIFALRSDSFFMSQNWAKKAFSFDSHSAEANAEKLQKLYPVYLRIIPCVKKHNFK